MCSADTVNAEGSVIVNSTVIACTVPLPDWAPGGSTQLKEDSKCAESGVHAKFHWDVIEMKLDSVLRVSTSGFDSSVTLFDVPAGPPDGKPVAEVESVHPLTVNGEAFPVRTSHTRKTRSSTTRLMVDRSMGLLSLSRFRSKTFAVALPMCRSIEKCAPAT